MFIKVMQVLVMVKLEILLIPQYSLKTMNLELELKIY